MSEKEDVDDVIKQLFREHYPEAAKDLERASFLDGERYEKALAMYDCLKKGYLLGFRHPNTIMELVVWADGRLQMSYLKDGKRKTVEGHTNPLALTTSLLALAVGSIGR